jgi:thiol-disulfide isomerase/thioredoxin
MNQDIKKQPALVISRALLGLACLILPSSAIAVDAPTTAPAEAPAASPKDDLKAAGQQLNQLLGAGSLSDPAKRAAAAPAAIPLVKRMHADMETISTDEPALAKRMASSEQNMTSILLSLGDKETIDKTQALASGKDLPESLKAQSAQIFSRWLMVGKNADAQTPIADDVEKLDRANPTDDSMALFTVKLAQSAASPAMHERLLGVITNTMTGTIATGIKKQLAAAADQKKETQETFAKLLDKPMTIAGKQPDGKPFTSADWKGKVVLVDFWATWCGPCKAELPRVKKMYEQYHAQGLEIISVSNDYDVKKLTTFIETEQMPWPELFDADAASNNQWNGITLGFGIHGIPAMFLIDKKGIARSVSAREDMETQIPKLLAEPS